jgi:hypothetical protein
MKMKEDITREVLNRVTAMADREERAVLMTAVNALKKSDSTRALKVTISAQLRLPSFTFLYFQPHLVRFPCAHHFSLLLTLFFCGWHTQVLEERLLQLSRRVQQRNEESSSDDSSDERNGDSDDVPKPKVSHLKCQQSD